VVHGPPMVHGGPHVVSEENHCKKIVSDAERMKNTHIGYRSVLKLPVLVDLKHKQAN
jgi:hypothetical protein